MAIILAVIAVAVPVTLGFLSTVITIAAPYLAIAFNIYYYTALCYCFNALNKKFAPLYTVLSVLFDFGAPLFLFIASIGGLDKAWVTEEESAEAEAEAAPEAEAEAPAEVEAPAAE